MTEEMSSDARELERVKMLAEQQEKSAQLLIRRDLELQRANDRLRALDQMKSEFVSVVTHQLRTPLSGIRWTLAMLLNNDLGALNESQRTFIQKSYDSNNRMIELLNDMLLSDRIDSGKFAPTGESSPLPETVETLLSEMAPVALQKGVTISFVHTAPTYERVAIAAEHMRAVLQNLLENAVKYSNKGSTVTLELRSGAGVITFVVSDTGIGIPEESQKNVFARFFRAPNAVKLETDGSGLGLFIARSIVEQNGGKIWFESTEGKGTTFYVELPVKK